MLLCVHEHSYLSTIDGDVIINGDTNEVDIQITGSNITGGITFDNGCAVVGDMVYECDGSQRRMNELEKQQMVKRRAEILRQQQHRNGGERVVRIVQFKHKHGTKNKKPGNYKDNGAFSPCRTCQRQSQSNSRPQSPDKTIKF